MKCQVCGSESGKYPLCRACNAKKEQGLIAKCDKCNKWHYINHPCPTPAQNNNGDGTRYLYEVKRSLISKSERVFFDAIKSALPDGYCLFPQVNLASFIDRTDDTRYHNELFRNVDFLVTDAEYHPMFIVEINDQTHLTSDRRKRDEKVLHICEEAGIPIIKLWTSYGVNQTYIQSKIIETLNSLPVVRIRHSADRSESPVQEPDETVIQSTNSSTESSPYTYHQPKRGCYIATCVYGSFDCPKVWILRRFRDKILSKHWLGQAFIRCYYAISPILVKYFGNFKCIKQMWKFLLDRIVKTLQTKGFDDSPYND